MFTPSDCRHLIADRDTMCLEGIAELGNRYRCTRIQRVDARAKNLPRNRPYHMVKRFVELQVIACDTGAEEITGRGVVGEVEDCGVNLAWPTVFPYPLLITEPATGNPLAKLDRLYTAQIAVSKDCQDS